MGDQNRCLGCMVSLTNEQSGAIQCPYCGWMEKSAPESTSHLMPGTVLQEKYLIGRALGQGGFGITYLAYDLYLNIKLAVKEYLPQELAYRTGNQREVSIYNKSLKNNFTYGLEKFLDEARTLARFNDHPNIVSVRDFFKANGTAYLVMNYIEGITLKEYLESRQEPLHFDQALNIFLPVFDALKEVHSAGILHRDISPDNLLIDARGRVVLIDFGAARQAMGEKSRSMSVIMKAGYSPLEQYQIKGKQGPWTDIYAVGGTLYYAITGQPPPESLDRLKEDPLVYPSNIGLKIDPCQENALMKALAVHAEERLQTAGEFQEKLLGRKMAGERESPEADKYGKLKGEREDSKICPYCSRKIKTSAIKCKHCKTFLKENIHKAKEKPQKPRNEVSCDKALLAGSETVESSHDSGAGVYDQGADGMYKYPRAGLVKRSFAFIIDHLITGLPIIAAIAAPLLLELNGIHLNEYDDGRISFLLIIFLLGIWFLIYQLIKDGFTNGQSWGKKICGLMVVDVRVNQPCTKEKSLLRNLILYIGLFIIPFYIIIEIIIVKVNEKGLRLGDMVAKTQVIDIEDYHPSHYSDRTPFHNKR